MANAAPGSHATSTAVKQDDLVIPLIDFGPFFRGTPSDKHAIALSVTSAFKTSGFLYLKSHGIPPSVITRVFASSARFFKRPQSQKDDLGPMSSHSPRGYVVTGQNKLASIELIDENGLLRDYFPDLKETMEIGREGLEDLPNQWPDSQDDDGRDFKETMLSFFDMCDALHKQIMRAIALGMNLPELFFEEFFNQGENHLRLLHYPPARKEIFRRHPRQVRAGEHTDGGSITLLFQDRHGGLQARSPEGNFVDVTPIADAVVVNAGDLLARWSNDTIKSARHRVIEPPKPAGEESENDQSDTYPPRYSVAYFCNPNNDKLIGVLPGTHSEAAPKKYSEIIARDYFIQRLDDTKRS